MKRLAKILGIILGGIVLVGLIGFIYFNSVYPVAEPVPNVDVEITAARIARGEYLVRHVAGCFDCHSRRDWAKYAGPIIAGTMGEGGEEFGEQDGVPGVVYARNITPYGIGKWSDGELIRAITTGISKDGTALFPIMPYQDFNYLRHEDLYSIVAYLRSVPAIADTISPRHLDFPMNFLIKTIPLRGYEPGAAIEKSDTIGYGEYLTTIASCGGCHTPMEKGEPIRGMDFGGGMSFDVTAGVVRSANITPDKETGIGNWTKEEFIAYFKSFASDSSRNIPVSANEYNTVMPMTSFAGMTDDDLGAIYKYLMTLTPVRNQVRRFTPRR